MPVAQGKGSFSLQGKKKKGNRKWNSLGEWGWVVRVGKKVDYKSWNKIQIPGKFNLKYASKTKEMKGDLQIKSLKRHVKQ